MGVIKVTDESGATHTLDAVEGWRVMEILRDHGMPIAAICGGACACATCHVHVAPGWAGKLFPPRDDEEEKLDELPNVGPTSRLSCQIIWEPELDGLELELARGNFE